MRVGLTGGIGCGKSTVLAELAVRGFKTMESDKIVRNLLGTDAVIHNALRKRFGGTIFDATGTVDRKTLAGVVFNDTDALKDLEIILHPRVRAEYLARMEAEPSALWVIEIPLLFENKLETFFDFCVCVEATLATQLARLRMRGLSDTEAQSRMARQMPLREKIRRSHFVLSNNGSLDNLRQQIDLLLNHLAVTLS